jgi:ferredoxin-NADP reductase
LAGAAILERLSVPLVPIVWRVATVRRAIGETSSAKTIVLDVPGWPGHVAGQHVDVRLTAEDGYQAERSYSIASAPEDQELELTVERIDDGEVSPYLTEEVVAGDAFEVRGPVGGHFTWRVGDGGPVVLLGGGSGLVPLMSMLRHRAAQQSNVATTLLLSARGVEDILYRDELARLAQGYGLEVHQTLTRGAPKGWTGFSGRVDGEMLREVGPAVSDRPRIYICGPTGFVEHTADLLVAIGYDPATIRAERFGPTGS